MKKKLTNKLSLKKETLNSLTSQEMNILKGGSYTVQTCGNTTGDSCWCTVTVRTISDCTCQ